MKTIHTILKFITVLTVTVFAIGCADLQNKENLASAAGFKPVTPKTEKQQTLLAKLPADKVTRINYKGKNYYVLPDAKNNVAYVGGQKEYQAYRQLREQQQISNQNLEAASMNQEAAMDWGWGGWGGWGLAAPLGWY